MTTITARGGAEIYFKDWGAGCPVVSGVPRDLRANSA